MQIVSGKKDRKTQKVAMVVLIVTAGCHDPLVVGVAPASLRWGSWRKQEPIVAPFL